MAKWVHLATAPDQITAEIWVDVLHNLGISAMVHPADAVSFMGVSNMGCRVNVQERDVDAALEAIADAPDEDRPPFSGSTD